MIFEKTYVESANKWGKAYKDGERTTHMGRAMHAALHVFEAVNRHDGTGHSMLEILAGAIADIERQAAQASRDVVLQEARALVAGAVRIAHNELDRVSDDLANGKHFR